MKKNITPLVLFGFLLTLINFQSFAQLPDTWIQKGDFGASERYGSVGFSIGTKGYFGTGWATTYANDFWEYDPSTDTWAQKADFGGTARTFASGFSIGTKGYIGTGNDGIQKNDFWEYNPASNIWTQKADFGGIPREGAVGFSIGLKGYMGTGELKDAFITKLNDFWEYNPSTDTWIQKANVGGISGRSFAAGFNIGSKGYIGTGHIDGTLTNDFWEYDPNTDLWIQKADFAGPFRFGAFGCSNGINGFIGLGDIGVGYSKDLWEYSPLLDAWTQKADFGGPIRTLAAGFCIQNKVYIGTGSDYANGIKYKDFWEFTTSCITPVISSEPANQSITYNDVAQFTVVATDATSFQWQEDTGSGFADITDGGIYSNATNDTLDISLPTVNMTGYKYRCILTGNCLQTATTNGNATLTVAPKPIVITPNAGQTKIYGSADPATFGFTFAPSLVGADVITGLMDRAAGENVGDYTFMLGTLTANTNYSLTVAASPTFSITPITLIIKAEDKEKCDDGAVYSGGYTVTYTGFVNGEDQSTLTGALIFGGTAVTATSFGSYSIDPSGLTSSNYSISFANGTLVIKPTPTAPVIVRNGDTLISNVATGNQWFLDGTEITGSTGQKYLATANGVYYSIATVNGCSSVKSNSISVLDVSIKEVSPEIFDIYPNPSNGVVNIKIKTASKELYNIEIYNNLGALIWKQNNAVVDGNNIKKIDLNSPKSGLYTVVLRSKANSFAKKVYITK
jgi:hypothetical protein